MKRAAKRMRRRLVRIAVALLKQLDRSSAAEPNERLASPFFEDFLYIRQKRLKASGQGLLLAGEFLRRQEQTMLRRIAEQVNRYLASDPAASDPTARQRRHDAAKLHELVAELSAIDQEFHGIDIDLREQTISVVTPRIVLEGVDLGRFRVCLDIRLLRQSRPYRVIALDPNPAGSCDDTTHPHVQSQSLCEGEGYGAIKQSLADGRLYDFFVIVGQVLQTYNAGSAYTQLSDWDATECDDCGATVWQDRCRACSRCQATCCEDCGLHCEHCQSDVCGNCCGRCEVCDERSCDDCLSECRRCGEPCCPECLSKEICDDCAETPMEPEVPNPAATATTSLEASQNEAEIQPHRVGETAVSA